VKSLAADGMKEVIISGVNIGDFGKTTGENFLQLLKAVAAVDGIERFRIGSIEPDLLTDEIIEYVATEPKMMPHFHIPLQSGCDELLKLIGRRYDTALYRHKIELVKKLIPDAFIGIDLIVGVNGETLEMFDKTVGFVGSLDISFIHQFQYSEREGTRALKFTPRVTSKQKQERADVVKAVCERKHREFVEKNLGSVRSVLFESAKKGGMMFGYTDNYIRVAVPYDKSLVNKICQVRLTEMIDEDVVKAEIL
jgi:threonylcarbamoyladenosine tRNA methylthiotransferase MtaB